MVQGIEGTEDWVEVAHELDSCFDWSAITVWWSPSARKYFWYSDAGCSCNDHMDYVDSIGEFSVGDKGDVLRETKDWSDSFRDEIRNHKGLRLN